MADIPTDNPYSFRSFKTCASLSEETVAFSAILCRDGKKLAQAKNAGHGGSNDLFWLDREAQAAFLAYVKTVPPVPFEVDGKTEMLDMDPDFFISCMVQVEEEKAVREKNRKRFAKLCSTQVLPEAWRQVRNLGHPEDHRHGCGQGLAGQERRDGQIGGHPQ